DVALAVGVPQVRAFAARKKSRRATDRAKGAHRRIHAGGNRALRPGGELFVAGHAGWPLRCEANKAAKARAPARPPPASGASKSAEITASASAPAASNGPALAGVMPPMATIPTPHCARAAVNSEVWARIACGFTFDGKKLPNAM